jgi:NAD(P)-dependent dehydrogenase (short-subunit alcohol dehydrogenase family)
MDLGLKGKVAIVTGGARGIGKATVEAYAKEGANVVIGDMIVDEAQAVAKSLSKGGVKAIAVKCDVSKKADADNLAAAALKEFGKIDILFNNAGFTLAKPFLDVDEKDIDRVLGVMVKGVILCTQAVLPHMMEKNYGKIINTCSIAGLEGQDMSHIYCAAKFGVLGLTEALAKDMAGYGINVNAVCPGFTATHFYDPVITVLGMSGTMDDAEAKSTIEGMFGPKSLFGGMLAPEDIAAAVLFLSSDVSKNMTGTYINVSGGARMP